MSTEASFPYYDGPLSTYREWDALLYGVVIGIAAFPGRVRRDLAAEPSKAIAGALLAFAVLKHMNDP